MTTDSKLEDMKAELDEMTERYDNHDCKNDGEDECTCFSLVEEIAKLKRNITVRESRSRDYECMFRDCEAQWDEGDYSTADYASGYICPQCNSAQVDVEEVALEEIYA